MIRLAMVTSLVVLVQVLPAAAETMVELKNVHMCCGGCAKEVGDILKKVADVIRQDPGLSSRTYQVAGHTDSEKLQGGQFKDNWGLSVMRARQVVVFLVDPSKDGGGLKPKNWSASGYGEEDPVASNDTNEGKAKNRRVELVVVPSVEEMLDLKQLTR